MNIEGLRGNTLEGYSQYNYVQNLSVDNLTINDSINIPNLPISSITNLTETINDINSSFVLIDNSLTDINNNLNIIDNSFISINNILETKQNNLIAGDYISIVGNVISVDVNASNVSGGSLNNLQGSENISVLNGSINLQPTINVSGLNISNASAVLRIIDLENDVPSIELIHGANPNYGADGTVDWKLHSDFAGNFFIERGHNGPFNGTAMTFGRNGNIIAHYDFRAIGNLRAGAINTTESNISTANVSVLNFDNDLPIEKITNLQSSLDLKYNTSNILSTIEANNTNPVQSTAIYNRIVSLESDVITNLNLTETYKNNACLYRDLSKTYSENTCDYMDLTEIYRDETLGYKNDTETLKQNSCVYADNCCAYLDQINDIVGSTTFLKGSNNISINTCGEINLSSSISTTNISSSFLRSINVSIGNNLTAPNVNISSVYCDTLNTKGINISASGAKLKIVDIVGNTPSIEFIQGYTTDYGGDVITDWKVGSDIDGYLSIERANTDFYNGEVLRFNRNGNINARYGLSVSTFLNASSATFTNISIPVNSLNMSNVSGLLTKLDNLQPLLTAGDGINICNNVISVDTNGGNGNGGNGGNGNGGNINGDTLNICTANISIANISTLNFNNDLPISKITNLQSSLDLKYNTSNILSTIEANNTNAVQSSAIYNRIVSLESDVVTNLNLTETYKNNTCSYMVNTCSYMVNTCSYMVNTCSYMVNTCSYMVNTCSYMVNSSSYSISSKTYRDQSLTYSQNSSSYSISSLGYRNEALSYRNSANTHQLNACFYNDNACYWADETKKDANSASDSAIAAGASAIGAGASAATALTQAGFAGGSATAAGNSATNASNSANAALGYRNEASNYAQDANSYSIDARDYAANSSRYMHNASSYMVNTCGYMDLAEDYKDDALLSKQQANTYKLNCCAYRDETYTFNQNCCHYNDNCYIYANDAFTFKNNACYFADQAQIAADASRFLKGSDNITIDELDGELNLSSKISVTNISATNISATNISAVTEMSSPFGKFNTIYNSTINSSYINMSCSNATLKIIDLDTDIPCIQLIHGTNPTYGADATADWKLHSDSAGHFYIERANNATFNGNVLSLLRNGDITAHYNLSVLNNIASNTLTTNTITADEGNFSTLNICDDTIPLSVIIGLEDELLTKQDLLTAGSGINISNNIISVDAIAQTLVGGSNINISNNNINLNSSIVLNSVNASTGNFSTLNIPNNILTISNTSGLQTALNSKQNTLIAGINICIVNDQINAALPTLFGSDNIVVINSSINLCSTISVSNINTTTLNISNISLANLSTTYLTTENVRLYKWNNCYNEASFGHKDTDIASQYALRHNPYGNTRLNATTQIDFCIDTNEVMKLSKVTKIIGEIFGQPIYAITGNLDMPNGDITTENINSSNICSYSANISKLTLPLYALNISNISFLQQRLDEKQALLTPGSNITIDQNNQISATGGSFLTGTINVSVFNGSINLVPNLQLLNITSEGDINSTGRILITGTEPTLYLRDTDHRSGMIHMNDNRMYFLSGVNNSTNWNITANNRWPLYLQTDTNEAVFGGHLNCPTTITAGGKITGGGDIDSQSCRLSKYGNDANWCMFSHKNSATTGGYALIQNTGGETRLNAPTNKEVKLCIDNATKLKISSTSAVFSTQIETSLVIASELLCGNTRLGLQNGTAALWYNGYNTDYTAAICQDINGTTWLNAASGRQIEFRRDNSYRLKLDVDGSGTFAGWCRATALKSYSDDRLKHNEVDINGLEIVRQLNPKKYDKTFEPIYDIAGNPINDYHGEIDKEHFTEAGFIAQEVLKTDISWVVAEPSKCSEEGTFEPYTLDYNCIMTYGIQAIKELDVIVQRLEKRIGDLESENDILTHRVEELENNI